jgi:hypothetical protein
MATHLILPMLIDSSPAIEFFQLRKHIDSNGNVIASKLFKRKLATIYNNHDKAEKNLADLINIHRSILDNECRIRPRPLHKILPSIKAYNATDLKNKIYGVFGVLNPSIHQYVQVNYKNPVAEVYRDAVGR